MDRPRKSSIIQHHAILSPTTKHHIWLHNLQINRHIVPVFYQYLQAQDSQKQIDAAEDLKLQIAKLIDAADPSGPFFLGPTISFVDIQMAPWVIRMRHVLKPYRGWPDPEPGTRWASWVDAIERNEGVKATTSGDELYLDSYERYAGEWDASDRGFLRVGDWLVGDNREPAGHEPGG